MLLTTSALVWRPTPTSTPTSDPSATGPRADPLAESPPDRLVAPALGLDADVRDLGLAGDGTLEVVREDGSTARFVLTRTEDYAKDEFRTDEV